MTLHKKIQDAREAGEKLQLMDGANYLVDEIAPILALPETAMTEGEIIKIIATSFQNETGKHFLWHSQMQGMVRALSDAGVLLVKEEK